MGKSSIVRSAINVLFLSYDGMTDPLGQSQVIPYLIKLSEDGFAFSLLSFEKKERFETGETAIRSLLNQHQIEWYPQIYTKRPPILSTLWDVYKMNQQAKILHFQKRFAILHCRSYIAALIGLRFQKKFGVKFIFDMRGFYADERVDGKIWNLQNPIFNQVYKFFKRKEKAFLENADYTISLTENGKKEIESWELFLDKQSKIEVIPCCADLDFFNYHTISKEAKESLRNELDIGKNHFIVSYLGSIGTWYMLEEMLDFFKKLLEKIPNATFLFITNENPSLIFESATKKGIEKKHFVVKSAKRNEVPLYLSLSDVSLFFIKPVFSKKASSPTKQGEIMGMGVPLICNTNVGDVDFIVKDTGCGEVLDTLNDAAYSEVLNRMENIKNIRPEKIRAGAQKYYSLESGAQKYLSVYKKILGKNA
jgi:glycosyltransferase involved in cell wall biosynthesis